ncbi:nuclear transport factor 2 family protein [Kribbella sp. NPDC056861]|uniref:terpene synthase family protein n=1 Tax=Kribbella sp. NPDC056861 TaxID=3154857 RepID=UPI0034369545
MTVATVEIPLLDCPFPSAINPHADRMHRATIEWASRHRMLDTARLIRLDESKIGYVAAWTNPLLDPAMAQLTCDFYVWLFAVDDGYCDESPEGADPVVMTRMAAGLIRILADPDTAVPEAGRCGPALQDLRHRVAAVARPGQLDRWIAATKDYLFGIVWEASNRARGAGPSLDEYVALRPLAGGLPACFALLDVCGRYEVDAWYDEVVLRISRMAGNVIAWDNDLTSYLKEVADFGAMHNLVTVLAADRGVDPQQAVQLAVALRDAELRHLQDAEGQLTAVSTGTAQYLTALHHWISGYLRFTEMSSRYTTPGRSKGPTMNTTADAPRDPMSVMQAWADTTNDRDAKTWADCYTEDSVYEDLALGQTFRGHAELEAIATAWFDASTDLHIELGDCFAVDGRGAMPWTLSGTLTGKIPGLPDSAKIGNKFEFRGVEVLEFGEDGRIRRESGNWSLYTLLDQLGVFAG